MVFCEQNMASQSRGRRKAFTIEEKGAIIRRLENGESNSSVAKEYGVGHSTISSIFKNKDQIMKSFDTNAFKSKRLRKSRQENVDQALFEWYKNTSNKGTPITGPMLQEMANTIAVSFGILNFNCSASWITRFKIRHNIVAGKIVETSSVGRHNIKTSNWMTSVWPKLRRRYSDDEIFSANETGLFYKLMPHRTLKCKVENCSNGEMASERITVMTAANMSGTEKKKLLIIGKSQNFKNLDSFDSLPADYAYNSKAWMTSDIFKSWLQEWDHDLTKEKKKILLLVDDCLAHSKVTGLRCINLCFLHPNKTAHLQPINQGVIQSLKTNYRKNLVLKIINCLDSNKTSITRNITMLDAIIMVNDAWTKLSQITIQNSFRRAGFCDNCDNLPVQMSLEKDDVPFPMWVQQLDLGSLAPPGLWEDYVDIDSALITCEESMYENHFAIKHKPDKEDDEVEEVLPTAAEALKAAETLSQFVYGHNITIDNSQSAISLINNSVRDFYYYNIKRKKR